MKQLLTMLVALLTAVALQAQTADRLVTQNDEEEGKKVVAYVTSWTTIMPDPMVMTHINYAFGGVGDDHRSVYADNLGRLQQIVKLKEKNPRLKVLLSVGGWGRGGFSPMAADADCRRAFAQACRTFCEQQGLDGIDIDWEFPGDNSSGETSPRGEKQNYTLLMRDLREALGEDLLLTMASSSDPSRYDFRSCMQYLDFVNVMTYDMAGPPNHHSALYRGGTVGNGYLVADESISRHLQAGIPAKQLVMGLAFYGNSGRGEQISLQEIKWKLGSGDYVDHWDDVAKVPYLTTKDGSFAYGYDNQQSLTIKCQYILDRGLAGGMYWEYGNDDRLGTERKTVYNCLLAPDNAKLSIEEAALKQKPTAGRHLFDLSGRLVANPLPRRVYISAWGKAVKGI
ncbi:MAG: glycoside hydrolase family 18 protein [Prevotella sp.]|nr:glycoside hydrolase family 18 protein [Prevotella sp.]